MHVEKGTTTCKPFSSKIVGHRVLVVDDLLATGGTLLASIALVQQAGGVVEECFVLMELGFLKAREKFSDYTKITSLVVYDDE